ncbi:N-acetylmuramic acid 6-phosphate etherase [Defluviimonas sp. WL0002]|uniref:N-acetylmuramic acid 6-phosphate etherase n=1 Tax=Albidovulum marisflavi TaxID=2984159 RepID=A0ABT2ZFV3_9RHOB|nr:N-acetylmuramic acid 6-phosphate etherase [Defluviimonas sp. WL0002]MCV2869991.1 N-acetylmuramic acid 6-phosphate etherase [Defluviimonas sp. WL0002]
MALPRTEDLHPDATGLDTCSGVEALTRLLSGQSEALSVVAHAFPAIEVGAGLMADALRGDGRIVYAGAGSSGLMAMADALELPATFGIDPDRIEILMAGGLPRDSRMPGSSEDDAASAEREAGLIRRGDVVVAVAASGSTPYALAVAKAARAGGASVIAIANNENAPIFDLADVSICLATPPEVIAGSTRMGAGTAQKVALNLMSTLMGIRLGQIYDGMMVGLVADNAKLRGRARGIVARIAGCGADAAEMALAAADGAAKPAVLIARGMSPDAAAHALRESNQNLRAALAHINSPGRNTRPDTTNKGRG